MAADAGWVSVGTDHDTAAFAVPTVRRWWQSVGAQAYPHATDLMITADDRLLPARYTLRGAAQCFPVAVEVVLPPGPGGSPIA